MPRGFREIAAAQKATQQLEAMITRVLLVLIVGLLLRWLIRKQLRAWLQPQREAASRMRSAQQARDSVRSKNTSAGGETRLLPCPRCGVHAPADRIVRNEQYPDGACSQCRKTVQAS